MTAPTRGIETAARWLGPLGAGAPSARGAPPP
jgi:hypothetical protein